jgi:hypothetical protein
MRELKGFQPSNPAEKAAVEFLRELQAWHDGLREEYARLGLQESHDVKARCAAEAEYARSRPRVRTPDFIAQDVRLEMVHNLPNALRDGWLRKPCVVVLRDKEYGAVSTFLFAPSTSVAKAAKQAADVALELFAAALEARWEPEDDGPPPPKPPDVPEGVLSRLPESAREAALEKIAEELKSYEDRLREHKRVARLNRLWKRASEGDAQAAAAYVQEWVHERGGHEVELVVSVPKNAGDED